MNPPLNKLLVSFALALTAFVMAVPGQAAVNSFEFTMTPTVGSPLPNALGVVRIDSAGPVEIMEVRLSGLPPNTDFDLFVIQVPTAPFGLCWYQGDLETDAAGNGFGTFVGRFSLETFIVAPGIAAAPPTHTAQPFPDAVTNPATRPVHTYHLGLWFNSPADAARAGFPASVTPFNGDHHAGVQVLNTAQFKVLNGPLHRIQP